MLNKFVHSIEKNKIGPLSLTIHKGELQMDKRTQCEKENSKANKENDREYIYDLGVEKDFLNHTGKAHYK